MRIIHPRPALGSQKFIGVQFRDGAADVDELPPAVEQALLQHGFTIEKTLEADAEPPADDLYVPLRVLKPAWWKDL